MSGSLTIRVPKNDNQVEQASLPETMLEEICSFYLTRNEFVAEMEPSFFPPKPQVTRLGLQLLQVGKSRYAKVGKKNFENTLSMTE